MSTGKSVYSKIAALVVVVSMFVVSVNAIAGNVAGVQDNGWIPPLLDDSQSTTIAAEPEVVPHVDEQQVYCLAKNIYHEARHESYEGKLAVAQVTLNRAESEKFPSTVCEVVYQKTRDSRTNKLVCQFSWVCSKQIRNSKIKSPNLWEESYEIARQVLTDGLGLDKLSSAMYYHAVYVNPRWGLERITRIGQHIFYSEQRVRRKRI